MPGEDKFTIWIKTHVDTKGVKNLQKAIDLLQNKLNLGKNQARSFLNIFEKAPSLTALGKASKDLLFISKKLKLSASDTVKSMAKVGIGLTKSGSFYETLTDQALRKATVIKRIYRDLQQTQKAEAREKAKKEAAANREIENFIKENERKNRIIDKANQKLIAMKLKLDAALQKEAEKFKELYSIQNPLVGLSKRYNVSVEELEKNVTDAGLKLGILTKEGTKYYYFADKATGKTIKLDQGLTRTVRSMKRFRFENLSFLFLGMQISRLFGGWVRQIADVIGITDIWQAILQTILIPVLMDLLPYLIGILNFFNQHPIFAKAVGIFVLLAASLGTLLFYTIQFLFAWRAFKTTGMFTSIAKAGGLFKWLGAIVGGLTVPFLAILAVIIIVAVGIYIAWKKNILGMRDTVTKFISAIKGVFGGLIDFFKGVFTIIKGIFSGNTETVIKGFKLAFSGLWKFIKNGFKMLGYAIKIVLTGALVMVYGYIKKVIKGLLSPIRFIGEKLHIGWLEDIGNINLPELPTSQYGRHVSKSGLYYLHAGETVTSPTGRNAGVTNNATFSINVYGNADPRRTAEEVLRVIKPEFERLSGSRRI